MKTKFKKIVLLVVTIFVTLVVGYFIYTLVKL